MSPTERMEAIVHGLVQGVFYRHNTRLQAERIGLVGTVRNLPDGTVRVVAEGTRDQLERLLRWLHRGPESAAVDRVTVSWEEPNGQYHEFRIAR